MVKRVKKTLKTDISKQDIKITEAPIPTTFVAKRVKTSRKTNTFKQSRIVSSSVQNAVVQKVKNPQKGHIKRCIHVFFQE